MDKKEFLKALVVVGLINSIVTAVIVGIIYLIIVAIITMPFTALLIVFFVIVGYVSAYIYLKFKGKE